MDGELSKKMIVLEGGSVFLQKPPRDEKELDVEKKRATFIADVHKKAWVHAIGVGDRDLFLGPDFIRSTLLGEYGLRLVCANLYSTVENNPLVEPYVVITRDKYIIVVIGLLGRKPVELLDKFDVPLPLGFNVQKPADALTRILQKLEVRKPQPDFYIILAHMGQDELKELVPIIPKNAIVFRSYNAFGKGDRIEFVEHVPVIEVNGRGRNIARVDVQFSDRAQPFKEKIDEEQINRQIADYQKRIENAKARMETVGASLKGVLEKRIVSYKQDIERLKLQLKGQRWAPNMLRLNSVLIDKAIGDEAAIAAMIKDFKAQMGEAASSNEKEMPYPILVPGGEGKVVPLVPLGKGKQEGGKPK